MTYPNVSTALASIVVDELALAGVKQVFISPGSRSAPLAIAASAHRDLTSIVVIDERSAAFMALGAAKASGRPTAVVATSGTAVANHLPAIVEASMSHAPLVAVSADRPARLVGVGANQTIDQIGIFERWVRAQASLADRDGTDQNDEWRADLRRVLDVATAGSVGPVHINVALDEPLAPTANDGRSQAVPYTHPTPRTESMRTRDATDQEVEAPPAMREATRALIVAGDGEYDRNQLRSEASRLGWPVLATALSNMRGSGVVSSYRAIGGGGELPQDLRPDLVVAVGSLGPDPVLETIFACAAERIRVDSWGRPIDPGLNATTILHADPVGLLRAMRSSESDKRWVARWLDADGQAKERVAAAIAGQARLTGAGVVAALDALEPSTMFAGSSLPIREVDAHLHGAWRVVANRGVSGIDGSISTAVGVALVSGGAIALIGDVSAFHDSNGLLAERKGVDLALVVIDNGGGGLFDQLPHRQHSPEFERLFVADPGRDLANLAQLHDVSFASCTSRTEVTAAVQHARESGGIHLIEAQVDRLHDLEARTQL